MKIVAIVFVVGLAGLVSLLLFQVLYYNIITTLYHLGIKLAAPFNPKAKLWVNGRKNLFTNLSNQLPAKTGKTVWFHCASLGEFEQGRPVIEQLKKEHPEHTIVLSFYSPSGYEVRKNYPFADVVTYLPADNAANAAKFIETIKPDLAVFVKYEFWYHYLNTLNKKQIPVILISAIFRKKQLFFRWFGRLHKSMLKKFTYLFVQNESSLQLLNKIKITNAQIGFDTRYDRVFAVAKEAKQYPEIATFTANHNVIIAGSTWPRDEKILARAFYHSLVYNNFKIVVVPHNIDKRSMRKTIKRFKKYALIYSELNKATEADLIGKRVLIIDSIGMLNALYQYADVNYIGGGFNKGIHNTLEAAVYGKPLIIGPNYKKFDEAVGLVNTNAALVIRSDDDLLNRINLMNQFKFIYTGAGSDAEKFIQSHLGGTETVVRYINTIV
ncbi:MAG: 3-deoxy-D-manno-octulosonic acid transferase [Bacteroidetes bacterium]|nr:3-deoxy-D-manno-octulosonic acid transferase [Bacteroidota bacterium]